MNITTLNNPKHLVTLGRSAGRRLTRGVYDDMVYQINDKLRRNQRLSSSQFYIIKPLLNRSSYGDIDIVISADAMGKDWEKKLLSNVFGSATFFAKVPGTDTTVFDYQKTQINVHLVKGNVGYAANYLRNDGAGELITIMLDSVGLVYNIDGLYLKTGIPNSPLLEIMTDSSYKLRMTGVPQEALEFYMYTRDDLFKIIRRSPFFNRQVFLDLESDTERLAKSPILKEFIEHLKATPYTPTTETKFDPTLDESRKTMTLNFESYARGALDAYKQLVKANKVEELFTSKFSFEKVTEITGLSGETLVTFMNGFATSFKTKEGFRNFILTSLPETFTNALLEYKTKTGTVMPDPVAEVPVVEAPKVEEVPKLKGKAKVKAKAKAKSLKAIAEEAVVKVVASEVKAKKAAPKKKAVAAAAVVSALPPASPGFGIPL